MAEEEHLPSPADDEDIEPDEYTVEAIRAKRKNAKSGLTEYFIKWENYPESQNTWEPVHNLKCPDLILKFEQVVKSKRKRNSAASENNTDSQAKRSKKADSNSLPGSSQNDPFLIEEDGDNESSTETLSSGDSNAAEQRNKDIAELRHQPKGFERGLPIERIVGSCTDDDDRLWFFVKWKGVGELELVDANELEEKAPKDMCTWYRERLYYMIKSPSHEVTSQVPSPPSASTSSGQVRVQ